MKRHSVSTIGLLISAALLAGCAPETQDATQAETPAATAAPAVQDPALARNLAAMAQRPGVTDLAWREPTERVAGAAGEAMTSGEFPAPDALAAAAAYSNEHAGLGLMVWHQGKLVASMFEGDATAATPFTGFSMHKSVLALAVLAAVEDGIISSLDDRCGRYIPQWRGDPRGDITLRQLLTQSSGLPHYAMGSGSPLATNLALSSKISDTALSFPFEGPAGKQFNYNNVNAQIVGIALENALGERNMRYADYLSQRLWGPLGANDAALWLEVEGGSPRYFAGLDASLTDWLKIGVMLIHKGRVGDQQVLSEASISALTAPSALNAAYGLNVWRGANWAPQRRYGPSTALTVPHAEPYLAPDVVYFDGFGGQRVYVVPSADLVVARVGQVDLTYDDSVIVNTLLRGLMKAEAEQRRAEYNLPATDAVYQERFAQLLREARAGRGLAGYDPLVPLRGAAEPTPLPRGESDWLDADTRAYVSELGEKSNSLAMMVWHRGAVVFEEFFHGGGPDQLVTSRSLSKPLSVIGVGRAIKEGYLPGLDVPLTEYIHEWRDTDRAGITLRHVLQMRSGLAPQGNSFEPDDVMNRAYLHPYHVEVIINEYPLVTEPGTRYDYSNANGELVAVIIERATGRRYEDWLTEAVLQPLGAAGGETWANRIGGTTHSGCCSLLPAETFLRLALLLNADGVWEGEQLLPDGFVEAMTTATQYNAHTGMGAYIAGPYIELRGAANPDFQLGRTRHGEPYLDKDLYLFDGNSNQVVYVIPRHDLVILRVGTAPPKEDPWDNAELPNRLLRKLAEATGAELVPQPSP
ncbi:MAG: serine hydrolase [Pseudomonadota bacterium]